MDLLSRLEQALEGMVEGVFTRAFKAPLQPVEVAKRLTREMESHRSLSVNVTYVPNSYTVYLSPDTYKQFQEISARLINELEQYLRDFATERDYQAIGPIVVRLAEDGTLRDNDLLISATSDERVNRGRTDQPSVLRSAPPTSAAMGAQKSTASSEHTMLISSPTATRLEITAGEEAGRQVPLAVGLTIGRGPSNTLVLNEPGISRRHAEVVCIEKNWVIKDLNSTNGTYVNDKRITSQILRPGDMVKIGLTAIAVR